MNTILGNNRKQENRITLLEATNSQMANTNQKLLNDITSLQLQIGDLMKPPPPPLVSNEMKRSFILAAEEGNVNLIRQLLSQGMPINHEDFGGETALLKSKLSISSVTFLIVLFISEIRYESV